MSNKGKNIKKLTIIRLKKLLLNEGLMDHINDCVKKTGAEVAGSDLHKLVQVYCTSGKNLQNLAHKKFPTTIP